MLMIIASLVLLAVALLILPSPYPLPTTASLTTEEALRRAKTGDILYFRSYQRSFVYLLGIPLTHVGVVVVGGDGKKYVVEQHEANDAPLGFDKAEGPHTYPLEVRLQEFKHPGARWQLYLCPLLRTTTTTDVRWAFPNPAFVPYNTNYQRDEFRCQLMPWTRIGKPGNTMSRMHCGNYALYVLKKLDILPETTPITCVTPPQVREYGPYGDLLKIV